LEAGAFELIETLLVPNGFSLTTVLPDPAYEEGVNEYFESRETITDTELALVRFAEVAGYVADHIETIPVTNLNLMMNLWLHGEMSVQDGLVDIEEHGIHLGQLRANLRNFKYGAKPYEAPEAVAA
jgi:hypothetical protein